MGHHVDVQAGAQGRHQLACSQGGPSIGSGAALRWLQLIALVGHQATGAAEEHAKSWVLNLGPLNPELLKQEAPACPRPDMVGPLQVLGKAIQQDARNPLASLERAHVLMQYQRYPDALQELEALKVCCLAGARLCCPPPGTCLLHIHHQPQSLPSPGRLAAADIHCTAQAQQPHPCCTCGQGLVLHRGSPSAAVTSAAAAAATVRGPGGGVGRTSL